MGRFFYNSVAILAVLGAATESALAGSTVGVPGPIAGAGAPALLLIAGAYWVVRRVRQRGK